MSDGIEDEKEIVYNDLRKKLAHDVLDAVARTVSLFDDDPKQQLRLLASIGLLIPVKLYEVMRVAVDTEEEEPYSVDQFVQEFSSSLRACLEANVKVFDARAALLAAFAKSIEGRGEGEASPTVEELEELLKNLVSTV